MYGYVDSEGRLFGLNDSDMSGNSGWMQVNTSLSADAPLTDDHGAALYKVVGSTVQERSKQEREADWPPEPTPVPTINERFTFIEDCLMELSEEVYK